MAQQQRRRKYRAERIGQSLPAMSGAEPWIGSYNPARAVAERRRRQQAERTGECRGFVGQDVAEQVLGDDDVVSRRPRQQQHRHRVDQLMFEHDVGKFAGDAGYRLAPQSRRFQARWPCRPTSRARDASARARTRGALRARFPPTVYLVSSVACVGVRVFAPKYAPPVSSRTNSMSTPASFSFFSGDNDARRGCTRDRAQVRVHAEPGAQREQALFRTRPRLRIRPARSADGAEQHGVGVAARNQRRRRQGIAVEIDRHAADRRVRRTSNSWPRRSATARNTSTADAVTSGPMPSPGSDDDFRFHGVPRRNKTGLGIRDSGS